MSPIPKALIACLLGFVWSSCDLDRATTSGYPKATTAPGQSDESITKYDCSFWSLREGLAEKGYKDLMPHPMGISSPVMQDFLYREQFVGGISGALWTAAYWIPGVLYYHPRFGANSWLAEASVLVPSSVGDSVCGEDPFPLTSDTEHSLAAWEFSFHVDFMQDRESGFLIDLSTSQICTEDSDYYDLFCQAFFPEKATDQGLYQVSPTTTSYDDTRLRTFADRCAASHPDPVWLIDNQKAIPTWEAVCAQFERPGTAMTDSILLTSPGYLVQINQNRCMTAVAWLDNFRNYTDLGKVVDYIWRTKIEYMETLPSNTGRLVALSRPSGFPLILDKAAAVSATEMTTVRENIRVLSKASCSDLWGNDDYCVVSDGVTNPVSWPIDACNLPWKATMWNLTAATYETVSAKMWVLPME